MFLFRIGLPNILSLSRIVLLPLLFLLLYSGNSHLFLAFYILIGSTDFWDGYLARKLNLKSSLGKTLDSIADLFFYISSAYFLYFLFPDIILANQYYLMVFFSLLGLSFLISGVLFRKPVMMHTRLLRLNGALVYLVVITSFWFDTTYFVRATILSYLVGFSEEILIFLFFGHVDPDTKSIFHLMSKKDPPKTA
jgi:phosphatidylglycerophosphate synthase